MRQFIKYTLLFSALSTPAMAAKNSQSHDKWADTSGAYIGAYGGYGLGDGEITGGPELDVDGWDYGIVAGFNADWLLDETINRVGLGLSGGLEGYYGWSSADDASGTFSADKEHEYGISFRPGLTIIDEYSPFNARPYAIIGYRRAEFEVNNAGTITDDTHDGFELGIGSELIAYDNVGIRLDYSHVWYEDKSGFDPSEHDFRTAVVYHF